MHINTAIEVVGKRMYRDGIFVHPGVYYMLVISYFLEPSFQVYSYFFAQLSAVDVM